MGAVDLPLATAGTANYSGLIRQRGVARMLIGRSEESEALERLLAAVRDGLSGVLMLHGEPGTGKTALLDHAVRAAGDMRVVRVAGVQSEMGFDFAGLHQLLLPFLGSLEKLPPPQREALSSAFGLVAGTPPDRFLAGIAALTMITDAAREQPVLCVVDDAQWLDQASADALGFVARRLLADPVGMLFALRDGEQRPAAFEGLADLPLGGLPEKAARELLAAAAGRPLDRGVARRIVAATGGNPLALIELGRSLPAAGLAGAVPLPEPLHAGDRLEELFLRRICGFPPATQTLLLLAATEPSGDRGLLWKAAGLEGIGPGAADTPGIERILRLEPGLSFVHPLMRSAVYYGAAATERRRAHAALAAASDPEFDPDRRAWHLAAAAIGPDEQIAAELGRSADRARGRGGWATCAAFLERAARLTPGRAKRAERTIAAAEARLGAGDPGAAAALLEQAAPHLEDPRAWAQAKRLHGTVRYALGKPAEASPILLDAAQALQSLDLRTARDALLQAFEAAVAAGSFAKGAGTAEVLQAVRTAPRLPAQHASAADLALEGVAAMDQHEEDKAGIDQLRHAIMLAAAEPSLCDENLRSVLILAMGAYRLLDDAAWHAICAQGVAQARRHGHVAALPSLLRILSHCETLHGRFAAAEAAHAEAEELSAATELVSHLGAGVSDLIVLAWRGRGAAARPLAAARLREFTQAGQGLAIGLTEHALAVLELGAGDYEAALRHALGAPPAAPLATLESPPELIEAAARYGELRVAACSLEQFAARAQATGTDWALGLLLRSQALLAADDDAEELYRGAIDHLGRTRVVPQLGRAHLLYGEWLRRQNRRRDARAALQRAYEILDGIGAGAFAQRARSELLATGEHIRKRSNGSTREELTPQELQIAELAGKGASNLEIASQLFISTNTVAYHLKKVFRKLGVTSRAALAHALEPVSY
jgi:DNA-binding CsgD family transcriptional regulator